MADMQRALRALRNALDDVLEEMERDSGEVEITVTIAAAGQRIPRTRAFVDQTRLQLDSAGQDRVLVNRGMRILNYDVQGPKNLEYDIIIEAEGRQILNDRANLGNSGEDGGTMEFVVS